MDIMDQLNFEDIALLHRPLNGPRKGFIGEEVFSEFWEKLANKTCEKYSGFLDIAEERSTLVDMLYQLPGQIEQRDATVVATFMCWLGTNCGRGFLHRAKSTAHKYPHLGAEMIYGAVWCDENRRILSVNHGMRYIEGMLYNNKNGRNRLEDEQVRDHEVIEHAVYWLATLKGQVFLKACEDEIKYRQSDAYSLKQETQQ